VRLAQGFQVADIFQEIDEDLRRDRAVAFWRRYQNFIFTGVILIVLGTAGVTVWQIYDQHQREAAGSAYVAAKIAAEQDPKSAGEILGRIALSGGAYAQLARFDLAGAALAQNDKAKAFDLLSAIAGDAGIDAPLRGIAAILGAYLALDLGQWDKALSLAEPLTGEKNPYRLAALEVTGLAAYGAGDKAKAKAIFTELKPLAEIKGAPRNLKSRVEIMLDRLAG